MVSHEIEKKQRDKIPSECFTYIRRGHGRDSLCDIRNGRKVVARLLLFFGLFACNFTYCNFYEHKERESMNGTNL